MRGIAELRADNLSLRQFLGIPLDECTPDDSTLINPRNRLHPVAFEEVFQFVVAMAKCKKLVYGTTDRGGSTVLNADAAMKSIVRCGGGC